MKKILLNKINILLILLAVTMVLMIVVLFRVSVTSVSENEQQEDTVEKITINKIDYEKNIQNIIKEYDQVVQESGVDSLPSEKIINSNDPIFLKINDLKNKITEIKAPSMEYKDLHMNIMLSLLSISEYLEDPVNTKNLAVIDSVKKVKKSQELLLN